MARHDGSYLAFYLHGCGGIVKREAMKESLLYESPARKGKTVSKKIWRGRQWGTPLEGMEASQTRTVSQVNNCTVVPDSACFPVKEAMALIKAVNAVYESHPLTDDHLLTAADEAHEKYLLAKERMQNKAGKK